MPEIPVGNITFSLSGHRFEMSAPDLRVVLSPQQIHATAKKEGATEERAACAELVRQADADGLARVFHETYEAMAPQFGYETREDSRKLWEDVPDHNRCLMRAVVSKIQHHLAATIEARA